jgi:hypothetical protein
MVYGYSQVESIFLSTPINVPFSSAAATLSLSPSCLLTASSVLCVPFLMRTSTRKRGGKACSRRTRTPSPMTVAREQCVMVGVTSTSTVLIDEWGELGGWMWISGKFTTASEPSERGCSGSEMDEIRSAWRHGQRMHWTMTLKACALTLAGAFERTVDLLLVNVLDRVIVRVAGRQRLLKRVVEIVVLGYQIIEQPCAAVVPPPDIGPPAAGGQVRKAQDGGVCILLVVHGVAARQSVARHRYGKGPCGGLYAWCCICGGVQWQMGVPRSAPPTAARQTAKTTGDSARLPSSSDREVAVGLDQHMLLPHTGL